VAQGRVVEVVPLKLVAALEQAGAKPRTAGALRARFGRWLGRATASFDGRAVRIEGISSAAEREAAPAGPAGAP
jgi:hypothetical protein